MFLLAGIKSKIKNCGMATGGKCPVCGWDGALHITNKYMTPHVFFIPTFRFHNEYIATCPGCASVMVLRTVVGKAIERGEHVPIRPRDLHILRANSD